MEGQKIETNFSRAVQGGTGSAKAAGNYAAALNFETNLPKFFPDEKFDLTANG